MDTSPVKVTHAVPASVMRVLDAMTEENWLQSGEYRMEDRMCYA